MAPERRPTLAEVLSGRPMEHGRPLVLEISERHHDVPMRFAQPGTIAMLVAGPRGETELTRIVEAVRAENLEEVERLHAEIMRHFGRSLLDPAHDVRSPEDIPVFTTFRYGRKTLRRGMGTSPGLIVARSLALYDGAELDHKEFDVVHHRRADAEGHVMAVVVIRRPRLTELERNVIKQVPAANAEVHLGEDAGFFAEAIVARAVARIAERAVEATARELGVDGYINDVKQGAHDIYNAAVNGAHDAAHAAAQELGVEGVINAAEVVAGAVAGVAGVADHAVDAAVDFVVDIVGAAVDWVAHNIFTVDNAHADAGAQGNAGAGANAADNNAAGNNANDNAANDNAQEVNAADDNADNADNADEGGDQAEKEGGSFRNWAERVDDMSLELEALQPAAAVRELLGLRARMIADQNARQKRTALRGRAR